MKWQLRAFIPLPGPFYLSGRSTGRHGRQHLRRAYSGTLPSQGWTCLHDHRTPEAATRCARKERIRRERVR